MATQIRVINQNDSSIVYLDLSDSQPLTANFQFKDILDFKSVKGNHTFNFRVPSTPKNNLFFNDFFEVTQFGNYNPKIKVEATITQDTLDVFSGYLQLTNVYTKNDSVDEYECVVFSSVSSLGQVLSGKYLTEFDFSSYNFPLTTENFVNSIQENLFGGDIIYSFYDYGANIFSGTNGISDVAINITSLKPQIRVNKVFKTILNQSGFTYESTFLDTTMNDLYMDMNSGGQYVETDTNADFFNVYASEVGGTTFSPFLGSIQTLNFQVGANEYDTNTAGDYNPTTGIYQPQNLWIATSGQILLELSTTGNNSTNTDFQVHLWNVTDDETTGIWQQASWNNVDLTKQISVNLGVTPLNYTKEYEWRIVVTATDPSAVVPTWTIEEPSYFTFIANNSGYWASSGTFTTEVINVLNFDASRNLAKVKAIDFVTSLAKKFNLVIIPDELQPTHLYIQPYVDWIKEGGNLDWTDKLDTSKDIQLKPTTDLQAKSLLFTDAQSEDFMNANFEISAGRRYGSQYVDNTSNDFGKSKDEISTIFKPTISTYIPTIDGYTNALGCICHDGDGGTYEGIKLSFFNGLISNLSLFFLVSDQGSTGPQVISSVPIFSNYKDALVTPTTEVLSFAGENTGQLNYPTPLNGAYKVYWKSFLEETYSRDARMLSANFVLNATDIMTMNFNDVVFVKNEYFRINKISNYPLVGQGSCKVELIKVEATNLITNDSSGNEVVCLVEPSTISSSGQVNFVNTTTGLSSAVSQDCCEGFGYTYINSNCYQIVGNPNDTSLPMPETNAGTIEIKGGNNGVNGIFNEVVGNNNSATSFSSIIGNSNLIEHGSNYNDIYGNQNITKNKAQNSHINGDSNLLDPSSFNHLGFIGDAKLDIYATKSMKNNQMIGDFGVALGSDEIFLSGGADKIYNQPGRSGSGQFVLNAFTENQESITIGINGEFDLFEMGYSRDVALNGIRMQYPSIISFEINIVGHERGTLSRRSQEYSFRKISGIIQNTNNSNNVSVLKQTYDLTKESSLFTNYTFGVIPALSQTYNDGYVLNDGTFYFNLSTNGTSLGLVDWTIDFKYTLVGLQNLDRTINVPVFRPTEISGCLLWVDASDYSSLVFNGASSTDLSGWNDKSGNNHDFVNGYSGAYPQYGVGATIPIPHIEFDGIQKFFTNNDSSLFNYTQSNNTIFVVFESDSSTAISNGSIIAGTTRFTSQYNGININATNYSGGGSNASAYKNDTNDNSAFVNTIPVTTRQVVYGYRDGTTSFVGDQSGNTNSNTQATNVTGDHFNIAGATFRGFLGGMYDGKVYEVIAYDSKLSTDEINQVMNYLKSKWNT